MSEEPRTLMDKTKAHVQANLRQCCKDLLEWKRKGVLPPGPVREAAEFLKEPYPYDYVNLTEGFVVRAALEAIAEGTVRP